jgi:hypothetical protein
MNAIGSRFVIGWVEIGSAGVEFLDKSVAAIDSGFRQYGRGLTILLTVLIPLIGIVRLGKDTVRAAFTV